jgi:hypothetical protein
VSVSPPYSPPHFSHLQSIGPMSSQSQHSNITQFSASMHATQNFPISPRKLHRGHTPILPPPLPSVASNRIAPLATGANDDMTSLFCFYNVMALLPHPERGLELLFSPCFFSNDRRCANSSGCCNPPFPPWWAPSPLWALYQRISKVLR